MAVRSLCGVYHELSLTSFPPQSRLEPKLETTSSSEPSRTLARDWREQARVHRCVHHCLIYANYSSEPPSAHQGAADTREVRDG